MGGPSIGVRLTGRPSARADRRPPTVLPSWRIPTDAVTLDPVVDHDRRRSSVSILPAPTRGSLAEYDRPLGAQRLLSPPLCPSFGLDLCMIVAIRSPLKRWASARSVSRLPICPGPTAHDWPPPADPVSSSPRRPAFAACPPSERPPCRSTRIATTDPVHMPSSARFCRRETGDGDDN